MSNQELAKLIVKRYKECKIANNITTDYIDNCNSVSSLFSWSQTLEKSEFWAKVDLYIGINLQQFLKTNLRKSTKNFIYFSDII